jgi:hypothetical protein
MTMISCRFSKKYLRDILMFGIIQIIIGVGNFIIQNSIWISVAWITIGFLSIYRFLTIRNKEYLLLDNEILTVNWIFGSKEYHLNELKDIIEHKNKLTLKFQDSKKNIQTWLAEDKVSKIKDVIKQTIKE